LLSGCDDSVCEAYVSIEVFVNT